MRQLLAMTAVITLVAGCSATPAKQAAAPTPPASTTASTAALTDANSATGKVDGVTVRASMPDGAAPSGEKLSVAASSTEIPAAKAQVDGVKTVRVRLGDSGAQPTKPITLTFDLSGKPELAAKFSDTVIPVVESVSEDGDAADLVRATWDPAGRTVTATTTHLSDFRLGAIDLGKVADGFAAAYRYIRGDSTSSCRASSEVKIKDTTYTLTATTPGPVAGCLTNAGGAVAVDFTNATQQFYAVTSTPKGAWTSTVRPDLSNLAARLASALGNAKISDLLTGRGTGRLTFGPGTTRATINLRADPAALQAATIITGLEMLTGMRAVGGVVKAAPAILDSGTDLSTVSTCLGQALDFADAKPGQKVTLDEFRRAMSTSSGCASAAIEAGAKNSIVKQAYSTLGTVFAITGDLPSQLAATVTGAIGEVVGDNSLDFALTSSAPSTSVKPSAEGPTTIDRVQVDTWAYDKVGPDTYTIPRGGPATVYFQWKAFSGSAETRGDCESTITVTGGGTTKTKITSNCGSYNPGTYFELRNRGTYTATITIVQKGGGTTTATKTVTLQ
ncbi:hypothetical protein [Tsukamurella pseudospumae]|nr:hypothetical protein [Tsukamurella pseudospumae]